MWSLIFHFCLCSFLAVELGNMWLSLKNFIKSVFKTTALPYSLKSVNRRQTSSCKQPKINSFPPECHHLTVSNCVNTMCWDNTSQTSCTNTSSLPQLHSKMCQLKPTWRSCSPTGQSMHLVSNCKAVTCWATVLSCFGSDDVSELARACLFVALVVTPAPQAPQLQHGKDQNFCCNKQAQLLPCSSLSDQGMATHVVKLPTDGWPAHPCWAPSQLLPLGKCRSLSYNLGPSHLQF